MTAEEFLSKLSKEAIGQGRDEVGGSIQWLNPGFI
jgi:hypothetical protein